MRLAGYCRVSTQEQSQEGYSLQAQQSAIRAYAAAEGCEVARFYIDAGVSAFSDDIAHRPAFNALMADIATGLFDRLAITQIDRFARSNIVAVQQLRFLYDHGCTLVSLAERWDFSTASGRFQFQLMSSLAEFDSRLKSERTSAGIAAKRAGGGHHGAVPWGAVRDERGRLSVHPERADTLRQILAWATEHGGLWIATRLNERGIPTRQSGKPWQQASVASIVNNGAWLADQPEPWPSLWLAARGRVKPLPVGADGVVNLLTGLLRCACGGILVYKYKSDSPHRYLQCRHYASGARPSGHGCPYPRKRRAEYYEGVVEAWLLGLPPLTASGDDDGGAVAAQRLAIAERRRIAEELYFASMDRAAYRARLDALKAEEAALPVPVGGGQALAEEVEFGQQLWPGLNTREKNTLLRRLLVRVVVTGPECAVEPVAALARLVTG